MRRELLKQIFANQQRRPRRRRNDDEEEKRPHSRNRSPPKPQPKRRAVSYLKRVEGKIRHFNEKFHCPPHVARLLIDDYPAYIYDEYDEYEANHWNEEDYRIILLEATQGEYDIERGRDWIWARVVKSCEIRYRR